jgi:hypothetical protein
MTRHPCHPCHQWRLPAPAPHPLATDEATCRCLASEPKVVIAVPAAGWNRWARNRLSVLHKNVFPLLEMAILPGLISVILTQP